MQRKWMASAFVAVFALGLGAGKVFSQDEQGGGGQGGAEQGGPTPEQMQAWMDYMTPGDAHKRMAAQNGEWTIASKIWMAGPDGPAEETTGQAKFRMMLGNRYQVQEYTGIAMGMPFQGFGVNAFDNATKEYVGTWFDTFGTGAMVTRGKADDKGVITTEGDIVEPSGGTMHVRQVVTPKGDDSFVLEMYMSGGPMPAEAKWMELTYTRKK